jgi:hypothetical protein
MKSGNSKWIQLPALTLFSILRARQGRSLPPSGPEVPGLITRVVRPLLCSIVQDCDWRISFARSLPGAAGFHVEKGVLMFANPELNDIMTLAQRQLEKLSDV